MNSLLIKAGVPQIRCVATGGAAGSLSYEVMIGNRWIPCNYQFAAWWVGYVCEHSRKVSACLKKSRSWTGTTRIGGALWYTSWASTEQGIASSSCAPVTRMSAHSLLNNSGESLRGSYER
ncbi:hypothetical protein EDF78_10190 [Rahnella sp. BIGb0236]|nr:hypothetical protein EDF78_10190 [Rahnella sp. BIGb0236]